jgi:hypothetical protein
MQHLSQAPIQAQITCTTVRQPVYSGVACARLYAHGVLQMTFHSIASSVPAIAGGGTFSARGENLSPWQPKPSHTSCPATIAATEAGADAQPAAPPEGAASSNRTTTPKLCFTAVASADARPVALREGAATSNPTSSQCDGTGARRSTEWWTLTRSRLTPAPGYSSLKVAFLLGHA